MEKDIILNGIHIGEHSFEPDKIIEEINERCIKRGLNFVTIRTGNNQRRTGIPQEYFIKWAKYLAENKIYFNFFYTVQHAPFGKESYFEKETVEKMKEIAGEYFLGDMIGETGSSFAAKFPGFYAKDGEIITEFTDIKTDYKDMKEAHEGYIADVKKYISVDKKLGMPSVLAVEATALNKYNIEAGVEIPMIELMCGNPDILLSSLRGLAKSSAAKIWGTYVAHEWYGGMRHLDTLKRKRLELAYKYAYMAGSNVFCLESGDEKIESFGEVYESDSVLCEEYRKVLVDMSKLINEDVRPKGGPKARVAFISGLHDAWCGWGGSSVWNQFYRKEWGYGEAEYSWRVLDNIGTKRTWCDIGNFGDEDLSSLPAYGMYDIVPIEADVEKLSEYDYLIFLGYNSMTDENMDKLVKYVESGGKLMMCAAHLNKSVKREGEIDLISNEKIEKLFGCKYSGEIVSTNDGLKFKDTSADDNLLYPGTKDMFCDPILSAGYVNYAKFEISAGVETAQVSDAFCNVPSGLPAVIENKLGSGVATLVTTPNYPGHPAVFPLYNTMVREIITSSARNCEIKVIGNDRLRYSVYEGGKIYLLNTDYDLPIFVKILKDGNEQSLKLEPMELKIIQ